MAEKNNFFFDYPNAERLLAKRRASMQRSVAVAGSSFLLSQRISILKRVDDYRSSLPAHRRNWFDTLSDADQRRLALYRSDRRSEIEKDHEEERDFGWSAS